MEGNFWFGSADEIKKCIKDVKEIDEIEIKGIEIKGIYEGCKRNNIEEMKYIDNVEGIKEYQRDQLWRLHYKDEKVFRKWFVGIILVGRLVICKVSGQAEESNGLLRDSIYCLGSAWDRDKLVGLVNAIDDDELTAYVHYLCANPEYQGQGIGKELLRRIKEKYKSFLYIILIAENEPLIKYYRQNGFEYIDGRYVFMIKNG